MNNQKCRRWEFGNWETGKLKKSRILFPSKNRQVNVIKHLIADDPKDFATMSLCPCGHCLQPKMPTLGIWQLGNWETEKIQDSIPNEKIGKCALSSTTFLRMIQKISPQCHCAPVDIVPVNTGPIISFHYAPLTDRRLGNQHVRTSRPVDGLGGTGGYEEKEDNSLLRNSSEKNVFFLCEPTFSVALEKRTELLESKNLQDRTEELEKRKREGSRCAWLHRSNERSTSLICEASKS